MERIQKPEELNETDDMEAKFKTLCNVEVEYHRLMQAKKKDNIFQLAADAVTPDNPAKHQRDLDRHDTR